MKKYITVFVIAVLLVLPTIFAVKSYMDARTAPPTDKSIIALEICDANGKVFTFKKTDSSDEFQKLMMFFLGTSEGATEISVLPETVAEHTPFKVSMSTAVRTQTYQYYLSSTPSLCYMLTPDGKVYHLDGERMEEFLEMKYAESLYPGSVRPTLTLSEEFKVAPTESTWSYKTYSSGFITADSSSVTTSTVQTFSLFGGLSVAFDIKPDFCKVKITDTDGNVKFDDIYENLGSFRVEQETHVSVEITAEWNEDASRDYKGKNTYIFNATVNAPASFYAVKTSLYTGDLVALTAKNVSDPSKITFKCEPDLGTKAVFFKDGDSPYAHALLAIPNHTIEGTYTVTLSYGSTVQEIPLTVSYRNSSSTAENITADSEVISDTARDEFDALVKSLTENPSADRLFEGNFLYYSNLGFDYNIGFNKFITFNGDASKPEASTNVCYTAASGTDVPVLNNGKVIYTGELKHTGKIVVVDHGIGLLTWYYGMGDITVAVGDEVSKGDKLGTVGTPTFMLDRASQTKNGVNVGMTVGDTFVCFYPLWATTDDGGDGGILMYGVLEPEEEITPTV